MANVVRYSGLVFVQRDCALQRIRSEPRDDCLGSRGDDALGLSFSEMAVLQSPRQQKDPCARKHSFFLPLSWTANRRL